MGREILNNLLVRAPEIHVASSGLAWSGGKSSSIPWLESLSGILPYFRTTFLFKSA